MAKSRLGANSEIDVLSGPEGRAYLRAHLQGVVDYLEDTNGNTEGFTSPGFATDGSGNGSGTVYQVAQGFRAYLLRIAIDFFGSTAASPVTCDARVVADEISPSALVAVNDLLPSVYEASRSHSPLFQSGQSIIVAITGGPASTKIFCRGQVLLVPVTRRPAPDALIPPRGGD